MNTNIKGIRLLSKYRLSLLFYAISLFGLYLIWKQWSTLVFYQEYPKLQSILLNIRCFTKNVEQLPSISIPELIKRLKQKYDDVTLCLSDSLDKSINNTNPKIDAIQMIRYSRFANNGFQFLRALRYCEIYNVHILFIPYNFLRITTNLHIDNNITITPLNNAAPSKMTILRGQFYFGVEGVEYDFIKLMGKVRNELRKLLPIIKTDDSTLYIHVRSGDIFVKNPHRNYGQPPLCYYLDIIKLGNFSRVEIIAENRNNPVISRLLTFAEEDKTGFYSHINFSHVERPLWDDLRILINAKNVAYGRGTFGKWAILMRDPKSENQELVVTYDEEIYIKQTHDCIPDMNYRNSNLRHWRNSREQIENMLNLTTCKNTCVRVFNKTGFKADYTI